MSKKIEREGETVVAVIAGAAIITMLAVVISIIKVIKMFYV